MMALRTLCFARATALAAACAFASFTSFMSEASAQAAQPGQFGQPVQPAQPGQFGQPVQPVQPVSPYDPSMQAGGLAPPPPMDATSHQTSSTVKTEEQLDRAKEKDSGRRLSFLWVNVEGGFEHVGLQTFNVDEQNFTAGFIETTATGGVVGAGLGLRLLFVTIGARGRMGFLDAWQHFSVGGEIGFHFPLGRIEPYFNLGGGYAAIGSFDNAILGEDVSIAIRGAYARAAGGLDIFVTPVFSIGAKASGEFMAMTRPGLSAQEISTLEGRASDADKARAQLLAAEGSGYGLAVSVTGVLGLHF